MRRVTRELYGASPKASRNWRLRCPADMCAPRASASTSSGCAYSRSIRSRTRRSRARSRRGWADAGLLVTREIVPCHAGVCLASLALSPTPRPLWPHSAEGVAVADVDVLLVALVGEVGAAAEGERGADLGGAQRPLEAVQPQGEVAGGPAGPADRAGPRPRRGDRAPRRG